MSLSGVRSGIRAHPASLSRDGGSWRTVTPELLVWLVSALRVVTTFRVLLTVLLVLFEPVGAIEEVEQLESKMEQRSTNSNAIIRRSGRVPLTRLMTSPDSRRVCRRLNHL